MAKCKDCYWYRAGGGCKNPDVKNGGFTSPLLDTTGLPCFITPEDYAAGLGHAPSLKPIRVGASAPGYRRRRQMPTEVNGGPAKVCTKCGRELPISAFYRRAQSKDGRTSHCKECVAEEIRNRNMKLKGKPW